MTAELIDCEQRHHSHSGLKLIFTPQFQTVRFFIELSYLGTHYCGWQIQPNGVSVQETLEKALFTISRREFSITGQGRTDAGVHALKTFAHLDTEDKPYPEDVWAYKLNSVLPPDIAIHRIFKVKKDAHARFSATGRSYRYRICTRKNPFETGRAWIHLRKPDINLMKKASEFLKGRHDFTSFSSAKSDTENRVCTISHLELVETGDMIYMDITADRFVMNMVRTIMGTLTEVGLGKRTPESVKTILNAKNREMAGENAPPQGLFLMDVAYPSDIFLL